MNRSLVALLFAFPLLPGCGGVPDGKLLTDVDEDDVAKLCEEFVKDAPARTVTCDFDGFEVTIEVGLFDDETECNSTYEPPPDGCEATVGDMRDCVQAFAEITDAEICDPEADGSVPPACQALFDCFEG
ncbi:MAG: hypothetical protein R3F61_37595 [Myxococcota bacterium]